MHSIVHGKAPFENQAVVRCTKFWKSPSEAQQAKQYGSELDQAIAHERLIYNVLKI